MVADVSREYLAERALNEAGGAVLLDGLPKSFAQAVHMIRRALRALDLPTTVGAQRKLLLDVDRQLDRYGAIKAHAAFAKERNEASSAHH